MGKKIIQILEKENFFHKPDEEKEKALNNIKF